MPIADSARVIVTAIASALLIALSSTAFADNAPPAALKRAPVPSLDASAKETRERMATLHEQMAACLRSDKSISECHSEMLEHCKASGLQQDDEHGRNDGHGLRGEGYGTGNARPDDFERAFEPSQVTLAAP